MIFFLFKLTIAFQELQVQILLHVLNQRNFCELTDGLRGPEGERDIHEMLKAQSVKGGGEPKADSRERALQ